MMFPAGKKWQECIIADYAFRARFIFPLVDAYKDAKIKSLYPLYSVAIYTPAYAVFNLNQFCFTAARRSASKVTLQFTKHISIGRIQVLIPTWLMGNLYPLIDILIYAVDTHVRHRKSKSTKKTDQNCLIKQQLRTLRTALSIPNCWLFLVMTIIADNIGNMANQAGWTFWLNSRSAFHRMVQQLPVSYAHHGKYVEGFDEFICCRIIASVAARHAAKENFDYSSFKMEPWTSL